MKKEEKPDIPDRMDVPGLVTETSYREFLRSWVVPRLGRAFHPDNDAADYVARSGGPALRPAERRHLNVCMAQARAAFGDRVYDVAMQEVMPDAWEEWQKDQGRDRDAVSASQIIESRASEAEYPLDGRTMEQIVADELRDLGLPVRPCGLNADWSVQAWHLGPGPAPAANRRCGEVYLLDSEEGEFGPFDVVQAHVHAFELTDAVAGPARLGEWPDSAVVTLFSGPLHRAVEVAQATVRALEESCR